MINEIFKSKKYYFGLSYLFTSLLGLALFISGFASYRYLLVISLCFFLLFVVKTIIDDTKILEKLTAICVIIGFVFDVNNGPLYEFNKNINIYLSVVIFLALEIVFSKYKNMIIEKLSDHTVFSLCKKCNYESHALMTVCSNCGYDPTARNNLSSDLYEGNNVGCAGTANDFLTDSSDHEFPKTLPFLCGETIIYKLKLGVLVPIIVSIDDVNVLLSIMYITNKRIIFIRHNTFDRGFSLKKSFFIPSIANIGFGESIGKLKIGRCLNISTSDGHKISIDCRKIFGNNIYEEIIKRIREAQQSYVESSSEDRSGP